MRTEYRHDLQKRSLLLVIFLLTFFTAFLLKNSEKKETSAEVKDSSTLVIDAGHGGIDCGALGLDGTRESDLNLAIALKLRALAELYGQDNLMIRMALNRICTNKQDLLQYLASLG